MAAALGARAGGIRHILLVERSDALGGILNQCIHTGFGFFYFGEELTGQQYAARFIEKMNSSDIDIRTDTSVIGLRPDCSVLMSSEKHGLLEVKAKTVILASGCRERPIGTLPIAGSRPAGIFTAGMAQKMVNIGGYDIGNQFVILGSGDVGMIMARQLKLSGKDILTVIEKEDRCGGLERNRINCLDNLRIPLRTRCTISGIHGRDRITGVTVVNIDNGCKELVACDTVITSIGLIPERDLSEDASEDGLLPDWLFLAGNACFVHNLVDDVTVESYAIGQAAANFTLNGKKLEVPTSNTIHANGRFETDQIICIACPKGCPLVKTKTGWTGGLCGQKSPVLLKK